MSKIELLELPQYKETFYCLEAYSVALKRNIKLVVAVDAKNNSRLYFFTDINMSGEEIIEIYRCRFQCEFNYRDARAMSLPGQKRGEAEICFQHLIDSGKPC